MNTNRDSAESLIEILSLCEQTLAAFDPPNGTHDVLPIPAKARLPESRRHKSTSRSFTLIRGRLSEHKESSSLR
jgi:hypothetical protein